MKKKKRYYQWKKNGKMMTENQWYASPFHFGTEGHYSHYKRAYKIKFKKK